uniref:RRM domain-containing protein n=1 Tax=Ananas comosus var. bracteatus TaxID=296719 RepID=A0A6V7NMB0_ANACO|nr:unnamed protein product [Ananas comosus var. bracteatus]
MRMHVDEWCWPSPSSAIPSGGPRPSLNKQEKAPLINTAIAYIHNEPDKPNYGPGPIEFGFSPKQVTFTSRDLGLSKDSNLEAHCDSLMGEEGGELREGERELRREVGKGRERAALRRHEPQGVQKNTVYVGGLAEEVDEKVLHAAFVPFGDIKDVKTPLDQATQKHRSFGFVTFLEREDAAAAIDNMDGAELFGRVLTVNYAHPERIKGGEQGWAAQPIWADADTWFERQQQEEEMQRLQAEQRAAMQEAERLHREKLAQEREGEKDEETETDAAAAAANPMAIAEAEAEALRATSQNS